MIERWRPIAVVRYPRWVTHCDAVTHQAQHVSQQAILLETEPTPAAGHKLVINMIFIELYGPLKEHNVQVLEGDGQLVQPGNLAQTLQG